MSGTPQQIGPYTIDRELGRGGMGVVYLGHDPRLDRKVAIKALPEHFAQQPERLARFEREARLLASLTHPNIAGVYGLEETEGARFLVMEFVEGQTLAQVVRQGPLAVDEAMRIASQIAAGVEAAHEAGVIHRDLKPGNIIVTPQGGAKVLDFGLAREIEGRGSSLDISHSPTMTSPPSPPSHHTQAGQIVGTAAYLSPEQARGRRLDRRTDIWSFGCILFEMLTGGSPYQGETMTDSLGAILHKEPEWNRLPADMPATVRLLMHRCLAKDPDRRLRDIGDARIEIEEFLRDPSASRLDISAAFAPARPGAGARIAWVVAAIFAVVAGGLGAMTLLPAASEPARPVRVNIQRGTTERRVSGAGAEFAISSDGSLIAFSAGGAGRDVQLFVRSLDQFEATPLSGTNDAAQPFFSPDGRWIGFFADNKLKKVAVSGGAPLTLCDAPGDPRGGSWGDDGTIAFTPDTSTGVWLVSSSGGQPRQLTEPDGSKSERSHRWPHMLPGSEAVLFVSQVRGNNFDDGTIEVVTVADGERAVLNYGGSNPKYAASGHLVFGRAATLYAAPFNADTLEVLAPPAPVLEGVTTVSANGGVHYAISESGALLFAQGEPEDLNNQLEWADRSGVRTPIGGSATAVAAALSPDGARIALQIYSDGSSYDIWVYEVARSALSRLTFGATDEMMPVWSPDGQRIAYSGIHEGSPSIFVQRADGSDEPRLVYSNDNKAAFVTSWSPVGERLAFMLEGATRVWDLYTIAVDEEGAEPEPFLVSQFETRYPVFSPDGRWIAYSSVETGRPEVYVRSATGAGGRWQVSIDGGSWPVWAPDGSELYFWWNYTMYAAGVTAGGDAFRVDSPTTLFRHDMAHAFFHPLYAVSPEGDRFLLLSGDDSPEEDEDPSLSLILNWFTELESRLDGGR